MAVNKINESSLRMLMKLNQMSVCLVSLYLPVLNVANRSLIRNIHCCDLFQW